jgi:hypothetical protein
MDTAAARFSRVVQSLDRRITGFTPASADQVAVRMERRPWLVAGLAALSALLVYLLTLAPGLTWHNDGADGGDLIAAVVTGGVPHPSGYPTYLLLGEVAARLPIGDLAYRFNLLSAVAAAAATGLTLQAARVALGKSFVGNEGMRLGAAAMAALTTAFSSILWSQAVITEVYALNAFFVALSLYLALRARTAGSRSPIWVAAAGALGLGLGNHLALAALAPLMLLLYWSVCADESQAGGALGSRTVVIGAAVLALLAGLGVYVVLPVRAARHAPVNWGGADTWSGFLWLVTGRAYAPLVGALPVAYLPQRALAAAALLVRQMAWWGVPVAYLGLRAMWQHDRTLVAGTALSAGLTVAYAVGYNTGDSYVYLIPATMLLAIWLAWGVPETLAVLAAPVTRVLRGRRARWATFGVAVALVAVPLVANWRLVDASEDRAAHEYGSQALAIVPANALIVTEVSTDTFPLWYFRYAERRRPDVAVVNGNLLAFAWYRATVARWHPDVEVPDDGLTETLIALNLDRRPVYLTTERWRLPPNHRLQSQGPLYRVVSD